MLSDRTRLSLVAVTIAASATLSISTAKAISFNFTSVSSSCTIVSTVQGEVSCSPISGTFVGDINGSTVTGGVAVGNKRLGDVGSGYVFPVTYVSPIPSGQGNFLFKVHGDALSIGIPPRENVYVLSFICNLGIERSCNGTQGTFTIRPISAISLIRNIVISDFSWTNTLFLPPFPTPTPTPTDSPTPNTTTLETASIPEPSSVFGLLLLGGAWLLHRQRKQTFPTGISQSIN